MTIDVTSQISQREPTTISHTHYCVVGDVSVDASAAIAPGVVLQALPGSRIVVGQGACLAGGVCIQSKSGLLTISSGATLGANVLVVGSGTIGANACVSPGSTVMNPQVADNVLLPPNTLSGESPKSSAISNGNGSSGRNGFSADQNSFSQNGFGQGNPNQNGANRNGASQSGSGQDSSNQSLPKNTFVEPGPIEPKPIQIPSIDVSAPAATFDPSRNGVQLNQQFDLSNGNSNQSSALTAPSHDRVYGRDQVSELISTLFPNRQSLNGN